MITPARRPAATAPPGVTSRESFGERSRRECCSKNADPERSPGPNVGPVTWRRVWCPVIGHKWQKKRSGGAAWLVCVRCGKERDAPDHVRLTGG